MRFVLASASPRRAELLRAAGFEFETRVVEVDETLRIGESPAAYVRRLAAEKTARAMAGDLRHVLEGVGADLGRPGAEPFACAQDRQAPPLRPRTDTVIVLGADTVVVVDNEILGKPRDDREVAAMLRRLSGRRHEVFTGVSLRRGALELGRVEVTAVHFASLSDGDIAWYVESGEGRDKAGAYAIQGLAARFIPRIEGSYSNVVGLPIACVAELLEELNGL